MCDLSEAKVGCQSVRGTPNLSPGFLVALVCLHKGALWCFVGERNMNPQ